MKFVPVLCLFLSYGAQLHAQDVDTPGIDNGRTLGSVTKSSIETYGGKAQGMHAKTSDGNGDEPGRTGLARIGNDLSDTIDAIDGD